MARRAQTETISLWTQAWRKLAAFRTVKQRASDIPSAPAELLVRIAALHGETSAQSSLAAKTRALWTMERLACTYARHAGPGDSLDDPSLPASASPIAHVGMGVAAVEAGAFELGEIERRINALARAQDRLFAFESLGAMLGAYERAIPRRLAGLGPLRPPAPAAYLDGLEPAIARLVSHGYGRLIYFNARSVAAALAELDRRPYLDRHAAGQGVGFAHAMVNHDDIARIIAHTSEPSLRDGLTYALVFWEWLFPGTLAADLDPREPTVERATAEIERARERGALEAFALGDPTPAARR